MPVLDLPRHIVIESGALNKLDELMAAQGSKRVLVVMDSFLANPPINLHEKVVRVLRKSGIESTLFSDYVGEPTTRNVEEAVKQLQTFEADGVIAIGGGSAIDLAKAAAVFGANNEIKWDEIARQRKLDRLPLLAVPTTAGTGSEATKIMVITNLETNVKMNPSHPNLIPDAAVLDPDLTLSLPVHFTAYTGLDALTHAIEAYVSNRASSMTDLFALKAIHEIGRALPKIMKDGKDKEARKELILASCYAGVAFSNASTNLAHAAGRPLGARFHIPHGLSVAMLLPFVLRFGVESCKERYADIAVALGEPSSLSTEELAKSAIRRIDRYNEAFSIWRDARKYIQPEQLVEEIPALTADALSGNGILTNRKVPNEHDIQVIFHMLAEKLTTVDEKSVGATMK